MRGTRAVPLKLSSVDVTSDCTLDYTLLYILSRVITLYQDILMDFKDANNQNIKITGYPTEKNLDLVQLLLKSVTKPGDLILDAFAGSSTTAEAAMNLGCDWIMLDNSSESLKATQTRFTDISKKHDNLFDTQLCSITFYEEEK